MGGNGTGAEERREEGGLGNKSEKVFNISFISLKAANLKTQTAARCVMGPNKIFWA